MKQLTANDFQGLQYSLPALPAKAYIDRAISVLQEAEKLGVQHVSRLLPADIVLTLSGVRAFDTYIGFEGAEDSTIADFQQFFDSHGFTLGLVNSEYESPQDFYFLVNHEAMNDLPNQYRFKEWFNPRPPYTIERMMVWSYFIEHTLRKMMSDEILPKEWLGDISTPHDIRFGILLGYPGEAIACANWMGVLGEEHMPNVISANIAYHDAYSAAWPNYFYTDHVKDNANVIQHQKLWSDILTGVYESEWHISMKANPAFAAAAAKISELKQP